MRKNIQFWRSLVKSYFHVKVNPTHAIMISLNLLVLRMNSIFDRLDALRYLTGINNYSVTSFQNVTINPITTKAF